VPEGTLFRFLALAARPSSLRRRRNLDGVGQTLHEVSFDLPNIDRNAQSLPGVDLSPITALLQKITRQAKSGRHCCSQGSNEPHSDLEGKHRLWCQPPGNSLPLANDSIDSVL
jgi:hypothetical protein